MAVNGIAIFDDLRVTLAGTGDVLDASAASLTGASSMAFDIASYGAGFQLGTSPQVGNTPWSIEAGDLNGDGKLDVVAVNYTSSTVNALLGNGDGTFAVLPGH